MTKKYVCNYPAEVFENDQTKEKDLVEVVRCKDCESYDSKNYYCTYLDNSNGPDGFCNFGEREINDS